MCYSHWNLVPGKIKQSVNHEYRHHPGEASHLMAIAVAVEAVERNHERRVAV